MDVPAGIFAINGVRADFRNETIVDGSGKTVVLRPQCFAVLRYLSENANRLVTKDELMKAVWPGTAVTDDSLVQCIHEIRRVIGDEQHTVLKTVPKRGYRLVVPAEKPAATAPDPVPVALAGRTASLAGSRPVMLVAAALAGLAVAGGLFWWLAGNDAQTSAAAASHPVIAVLPFDNLGADPDQSYFADGITEDLITDLSKISGLLVIARNSVWEYRDKPAPIREIADQLGADYVLEGSVRRAGDQIRINAQLIDGKDGHHLWAERYDGVLEDVLALQDKVMGQIVAALAVQLTNDELVASAEVETTSILAYDNVLRGLEQLHEDTEEGTLKAIALFEKAVELDPAYSRAYAALAAANWRIATSYWFVTAGSGWAHAYDGYKKYLAKAMEHPTALAYATLADNLRFEGRYEEAFAAIEKAMTMAPSDAANHVVRGSILNAIGRAEEAEAEVRMATRLDPKFAPATLRLLAISLFNQARYEEATKVIERIRAQQAVTTDDYMTLIAALGHLGRRAEVPALIAAYDAIAVPAAYDTFTIEESAKFWAGDAFNFYKPYIDRLVEGLRKAGAPEGAAADLPLEAYKPLMTRSLGEYSVNGATKVDVSAAKALSERGVPFIDLRAHLDYANGHIPGAANLSLFLDLTKESLATVARSGDEVVFYCHGKYCPVSAYGAAKAIIWGYQHVYYFAGGFPAWEDAGLPVERSTSGQ